MSIPRAGTRTQQEHARGNSIAGHATTAGTKRFAQRFRAGYAPEFYRGLNDHVSVSSIGMGTYLGDCDDAEERQPDVQGRARNAQWWTLRLVCGVASLGSLFLCEAG